MKRIVTILLVLLIVTVVISLAWADEQNETEDIGDNETEDNGDDDEIGDDNEDETDDEDTEEDEAEDEEETEQEVEAMSNGLGAQIRLLQLEERIARNILAGQEVIAAIKTNGTNTTELEAIISEMETLKEEVKAADPSAEDAVQQFVDLKKDAIDLSKQFRDKARALLTPSDAEQLRNKIKRMDREELNELTRKVRERIRAFNAEKLQKIFEILGIENTELIARLQSGNATIKGVRDIIKEQLKAMTPEEKKEKLAELKEEGVKRNIFRAAAMQKAKLNYLVRKEARLTKRLNQISKINDTEKRDQLRNMISNRLRVINKEEVKVINRQQRENTQGGRGE